MKLLLLLILFISFISAAQTAKTKYWATIESSGNQKKLETVLTTELDKNHFGKLTIEEQVAALSRLASIRLGQKNYYNTLELLTKAKRIDLRNSEKYSSYYNRNYGLFFDEIGAYNLSVRYHKKSYNQATDVWSKYLSISELGNTYLHLKDYENAKKCFLKQLDLGHQLKAPVQISSAYNNLGFTCYRKRAYTEAKEYYQKTLSVLGQSYIPSKIKPSEDDFVFIICENLGGVCYELQEYNLAAEYLSLAFSRKRSFSITEPDVDIFGETCLVMSLVKTGKLDAAEDIVNLFESHVATMSNLKKMEFLDMKVEICLAKNQTDKARVLIKERLKAELGNDDDKLFKQTAMSNLISQFMLDSYTQQLEDEKNKRELEEKKTTTISILWSISCVLLIILLIFAWQVGKNRQKKYKLEKQLQAVEDERLQLKLKLQESSLTDLAIEVVRKQETSEDLIQKMASLVHEDDQKIRTELLGFLGELKSQKTGATIGKDESSEAIIQLQEFHQRLRKICPGISKSEVELSTFIRLNFSNKKIASVKNCTENTIKTAKYRLKKKLNIESNESLTTFIQEI